MPLKLCFNLLQHIFKRKSSKQKTLERIILFTRYGTLEHAIILTATVIAPNSLFEQLNFVKRVMYNLPIDAFRASTTCVHVARDNQNKIQIYSDAYLKA